MTQKKKYLNQLHRHELDVHPLIVSLIGILFTVIAYLVLQSQPNFYLSELFLKRGATQYFVAFCAGGILGFIAIKLFKVQKEFSALRKSLIPSDLVIHDPSNLGSAEVVDRLKSSKTALARRCERVIVAYRESGDQEKATQVAFDDASFYFSATNTSYIFPRILAWAIPILGFVGTVIGISSAIGGFSNFLDQAGEIEELKAGIGEVTTGLAVAFDTTFLALLLSVIVMIPLSLVERLESRALLGIDIYINERLLKKFPSDSQEGLTREFIEEAVQKNVPSAKTLVEPAQTYAEQAANQLTEKFIEKLNPIQELASQLTNELNKVNQLNQQQQEQNQEKFEKLVEQIQQTHQELIEQIQSHPQLLKEQTQELTNQLETIVTSVQEQVTYLEQYTTQIEKANQIQQRLEENLNSLDNTNQLLTTFERIENYLAELKPALQQLSQPRRIVLTETSQDSYVSTSDHQKQSKSDS